MSQPKQAKQSLLLEIFTFLELLYHCIVREIRNESGSAALGIVFSLLKIMILVMIFYAMFAIMGMKSAPLRGDMLLFLVTGVQVFLMHNAAISAVVSSGSAVGPMMMHAPMTPSINILANVLKVLYMHLLAGGIILSAILLFKDELEIESPYYAMAPWFLGWLSGVVVGLLFLMLKPALPTLMPVISTAYRRANLITSGKFWVANLLPAQVLPFFAWNPLFHAIDQTRSDVFVNYTAHKTSMEYLIGFVVVGLVIGMMGEFWLRRNSSRSDATR